MGSQWTDGVVIVVDGKTHQVFYILTRDGLAVAYPHVYDHIKCGLSLGYYVRVRMSISVSPLYKEVEELRLIDRPVDHQVNLTREEVEITCNVSFIHQDNGWLYFENDYLGFLTMRSGERKGEEIVGRGTSNVYRIECRKRRDGNGPFPYDQDLVYWTVVRVIEEIGTSQNSISNVSTVSFLSAFPSTSNYSKEYEWTTAMITGTHYDSWFGASSGADPIRIPVAINKYAGPMVRGALHRLRYEKRGDGHFYALEMDPIPIQRDDFQFQSDTINPNNIQVLCSSRIINCAASCFVVYNEVLGDAIFPFHLAEGGLKVGDCLESLYYRVKNTDSHTHWRVMKARRVNVPSELDETRREVEESKENLAIEFTSTWGANKSSLEWSKRDKRVKEDLLMDVNGGRFVLDVMHRFLSVPLIKEKFVYSNSPATRRVLEILERDAKYRP